MKLKRILLVAILSIFSNVTMASVEMAVTVDDLPIHGAMPADTSRLSVAKSMLMTLQKFQIPEVYGFINAAKLSRDREALEILKVWVAAGYPLGNHTYTHKNLNKVSADEFLQDAAANEDFLELLNGNLKWHYFRYPYLCEGNTQEKRDKVRKWLKENKYTIASVTDDFEDWAWNEPYARCKAKNDNKAIQVLKSSYLDAAKKRFIQDQKLLDGLFKRPVRRILLLHLGAFGAEMLPDLLKMYIDLGVKFIPLSEAIKDPIYLIDPGVSNGGDDLQFMVMKSRNLSGKDLGVPNIWRYPKESLAATCN